MINSPEFQAESNDNTRLKRLLYRSWHRGCKETDIVLGHFAQDNVHTLSPALLDAYEQLLDEQDWDIWAWVSSDASPPDNRYDAILERLKHYRPPAP